MKENLIVTNRDKSLRALQLIQLEGLKELDRICRKHDIKYSLGGGTCLGQIRHGGFIPWDDDIDIDMTTENYEKFTKIAPKELDSDKFFLQTYKTDKNYKRSFSRFQVKSTRLNPKSWEKLGIKKGIFVDIFEWNYLPNNKYLRKIVSSLLFYIRWLEMFKMLNAYTLNPKYRTFWVIMKKITPYSWLFWTENKLKKCCGKRKTDWIIDNAVINGNHGGYRSEGLDEYEDVMFDGVKVMNKKNCHNFMKTIYGEHYNEWLPPIKRISHHKWYKADFGLYEEKFDIPENYADYITIKYNLEKLAHMKEVSLQIADQVDKICKKKKLTYYLLGEDAYIKAKNVDEYGAYWYSPLKIAMPRKDYEEFAKASQKYLEKEYFYQSSETDPEYKYSYARIRLNYTYIRENKLPKYLEEKINNGFFIKIIPLDNTSNDSKKSKKHLKKIKYLNHFISIRWSKYNMRFFLKKNWKMKLKMILLLPFNVEKLRKMLEQETQKYNSQETEYYVDATGYQLNKKVLPKALLGNGKKMDYNGHKLNFPENLEGYKEFLESKKLSKFNKQIKKISYIKEHFPESFPRYKEKMFKKNIKKIQKKYFACYLNYFDLPEYQLTVLRYDEKEDRLLTNKEIFESNEQEKNNS